MELVEVKFKTLISKYLVTNREYEEFDPSHCEKRDRYSDQNDQPVVNVSWSDAMKYCKWLSEKTGKNYRLPYSLEWEMVASGGGKRIFPWGNGKPTKNHANFNNNVGHTTIIGSYPEGATPEGLFDMAGNVWEWCNEYKTNHMLCGALRGGLRGGSWLNDFEYLRCSARGNHQPDGRSSNVGFRVVRALSH